MEPVMLNLSIQSSSAQSNAVRSKGIALSLLALGAFLSGCASSNPVSPVSPTQPTPPATFSVASIVPASGATEVATSATIQIKFSSAADSSTVNSTNIQVAGAQAVSGALAYDANTDTATFTPSAALEQNSTFTVTVSGVTSSAGTALAGPFSSKFTTAAAPAGTMQYQATLENGVSNYGQVSVDTSGNTTIELAGAEANTKFTFGFCPMSTAGSSSTPGCISLGTITTDASGNSSATMMFPEAGSWAGDFEVAAGDSTGYETNVTGTDAAQVYMSTLQPKNTVDQGEFSSKNTQAPLASGTVTYAKGTITFVLNGTAPNAPFSAVEGDDELGDSNSYAVAGGTSDANGDLTFSGPQDGSDGDIFGVIPGNGDNGFVGGFSVPSQ
jgi:hypothetical protein